MLAGTVAVMSLIPAGNRAVAAGMGMGMCPQHEMEYCVHGKDGFKHTAFTNHCFAKQMGMHILHKGPCKDAMMHHHH